MQKNRLFKKCEKCGLGTYVETSITECLKNHVSCDKCGDTKDTVYEVKTDGTKDNGTV